MSKENSSDRQDSPAAAVEPWATLTLSLAGASSPTKAVDAGPTADASRAADASRPDDRAELTHEADLLESLAALLAELPEVGGVETRDDSLLEFSVERPTLVAYTYPVHLESGNEDQLIEVFVQTEDGVEGRKAFFEKRPPKYTGN